jgi:hypothetical protein
MANGKTRKRAVRRDRRKAKMSGWRREGKRTSSRIGHGQGGTQGTARAARADRRKPPNEKKAKPLSATIAELAVLKDGHERR